MAPMLGVSSRLASSRVLLGILLLVMYGVGHCGVLVLLGGV